jgi:acetyl esterase
MGKNNKTTPSKTHYQPHFWKMHRRIAKWLLGICIGLFILLLVAFILFKISPWPNALIIRYGFDKNGAEVSKALEKHVPAGITEVENQVYRQNDGDGRLDVFYPENTTSALPTVVWVHGGAWVSGDKDDIDNYLKILASHGFTTVGVDYTIAPEAQYPAPLLQLNEALEYLQDNAERLHVNPNAIVLAGDSAGSQIVAQMATMITNSPYANEVGIQPTLAANKLKGMLLNCGAYDLALPDYNGPFGKFLHTVLWAYSGKQDFLSDPKMKQASVVNYVTSAFPASFITAGNGDPLEAQSTELATKLGSLKVPTSTLFYAKDHQPQLPHEYQFDLDASDGKQALVKMVEFLKTYAH